MNGAMLLPSVAHTRTIKPTKTMTVGVIHQTLVFHQEAPEVFHGAVPRIRGGGEASE
jgi:hypothetical protein